MMDLQLFLCGDALHGGDWWLVGFTPQMLPHQNGCRRSTYKHMTQPHSLICKTYLLAHMKVG